MSDYQEEVSKSTGLSLGLFTITTVIYIIVRIFTYSAESDDKSPIQKYIWEIIYILTVIGTQLLLNVNLSQLICGKRDFSYALSVTILPWLIIFGTLNIILVAFPGWLSPFSNTFGYLIAKASGAVELLKKHILKSEITGGNSSTTNKIMNYIYNDPSLLINEVSSDNFDLFWDKMEEGDLLQPQPADNKYKNKLQFYIEMKNSIAQGIWYLLTGSLVTSVTYNNIVNYGCETSVEEQQKNVDDYEKKQKEIEEAQSKEKQTYKTDQ